MDTAAEGDTDETLSFPAVVDEPASLGWGVGEHAVVAARIVAAATAVR